MRVISAFLASVILVVVSGCAARTVQTYNDESLADSDVANLFAVDDERFNIGFLSWSQVTDTGRTDFETIGGPFLGYPETISTSGPIAMQTEICALLKRVVLIEPVDAGAATACVSGAAPRARHSLARSTTTSGKSVSSVWFGILR